MTLDEIDARLDEIADALHVHSLSRVSARRSEVWWSIYIELLARDLLDVGFDERLRERFVLAFEAKDLLAERASVALAETVAEMSP